MADYREIVANSYVPPGLTTEEKLEVLIEVVRMMIMLDPPPNIKQADNLLSELNRIAD